MMLLVCVLIPCGTYSPEGRGTCELPRAPGQWRVPRWEVVGRGPGASEGGGVQNPEGARVFNAVPQGESVVRFRGCLHG
jgi:hypothetical protein